jgi:hypothetical protein
MAEGLDGVRVEFRMSVSHAPETRFDINGNELLQIRGRVMDSQRTHPQVIVRYAGQHQAQLARWCAPGKHLSVVGLLEVKTWPRLSAGIGVAFLVEASDLYPLNPDESNPSRAGVHAALGRTSRVAPGGAPKNGRSDLRRQLADA